MIGGGLRGWTLTDHKLMEYQSNIIILQDENTPLNPDRDIFHFFYS